MTKPNADGQGIADELDSARSEIAKISARCGEIEIALRGDAVKGPLPRMEEGALREELVALKARSRELETTKTRLQRALVDSLQPGPKGGKREKRQRTYPMFFV